MSGWYIAATLFYLGKLPFTPGSWGSLAGLVIWLLLPLNFTIQFSAILLILFFGVYASNKVATELNDHDPSEVVIDEAAGMWISLFMLPHSVGLYLLAFVLFRILDIFKPSFIHHSQNLPGGWGIMVDDILAGLFTLALVNGVASIL